MEETEAIRSLAALAQSTRLRVFRALVVAGPEGCTPSQLGEALAVAPAALSFHLKELANADLVAQQRDGRNLIYRANFPGMNALVDYLTENCCEGASCDVPAAASCRTC
jgi:DNA-binding transcriptional ArsR family regulator